ncbi:MAG: nitroreductase [Chloroflexi bacterium]|nr:MAG: nitroreductase [Chloroflexota bacterium]HEY74339.1 SagB/ThcOx family dehydrogenase [Thermoflexia bacterium]
MPSPIILPQPRISGETSLEAAIAQRRSTRRFFPENLTLDQISQLLWAAQGVTGGKDTLRAAPSAGACHPLTFYACRDDGVWRYHPQDHSLTRHMEQDVRGSLMEASWRQKFIAQAPCVFAISGIFERTTQRYEERGRLRYVPMDVGHAAQNLLLQAVALGLASVPVGAFDDAGVKKTLALPSQEEPLYLLPVGRAR